MAAPTQSTEEYKAKLRHHSVPKSSLEVIEENNPSVASETNSTTTVGEIGTTTTTTPVSGQGPSHHNHSPQIPQSTEENKTIPVIVRMADFETVDLEDKLNLLMSAINKVNTNFHLKFEQMQVRLPDLDDYKNMATRIASLEKANEEILARVDDREAEIANIQSNKTRINDLESKMNKMNDDMATLKGIIQVLDISLKECKDKIIDLTARSMSNNIMISGIEGDSQEEKDCKAKVLDFFRNKMQMEVQNTEIEVAHRLGYSAGVKPRLMVVRCVHSLWEHIFKFTHNLKDLTNSQGDYYSVKSQLLEPLLSQKAEREDRLRSIQKANKLIPEEEKEKCIPVYIKNKTLFVSKIPQKQYINPPTVQELFNITPADQEKMDNMELTSSRLVSDKNSHFRAHVLKVQNAAEIRLAYRKIRLLYPESNHIMLGYAVKKYIGYCDNGEYGGGKRIQKIVTSWGSQQHSCFCHQRV